MIEFKEIQGRIECITGLRIGGKDVTAHIGEVDSPIIRNPLDGMPYIPGSSLKGKMRFLLEHSFGKVNEDGTTHSCDDDKCPICKVFGRKADSQEKPKKVLIGRAIFRDAFLTKDSREMLEKYARETGMNFVEIKMENVINRKKGTAEHPREIERVPAGTIFDFSISFRIFEEEDKKLIDDVIIKGFKLIVNDALGSSGSRGYGRVRITIKNGDKYENI